VLALLGTVEVFTKIFYRWGLDGSFMRFFYEYDDESERQRLASTIFFFLLEANVVLVVLSLIAAPMLTRVLFEDPAGLRALQLTVLNTAVTGFTFFPFHVLRMEKRAAQFSALTLARSAGTLILRIVLVVVFGFGVLGVVVADTIVTAALILALLPWFKALIRPEFSKAMLKDALQFGLPRVPHALAQQVTAVGDKLILSAFRSTHEVGVYSIGVSFGLTQKLFLSAFEYAWAPFYYENARQPEAKRLYSSMTTYGLGVLALMTAGLSAIAADLLALATQDQAVYYVPAAGVVTWTGVGVFFQGAYLLTSIGLNITRNTQYYPVATLAAAAGNIGLNFLLVPRFGMMGAAWANAVSYALQAALAFRFSQRVYPVQYETRRIATLSVAAIVACVAARALPALAPLPGLLVRGTTVVVVYGGLLALAGFFRPDELRVLGRLRRRRHEPSQGPAPEVTELGGEIVAAELLQDELAPSQDTSRRRR
jgi:O-antigen/teichoic acid export membrane protein